MLRMSYQCTVQRYVPDITMQVGCSEVVLRMEPKDTIFTITSCTKGIGYRLKHIVDDRKSTHYIMPQQIV